MELPDSVHQPTDPERHPSDDNGEGALRQREEIEGVERDQEQSPRRNVKGREGELGAGAQITPDPAAHKAAQREDYQRNHAAAAERKTKYLPAKPKVMRRSDENATPLAIESPQ